MVAVTIYLTALFGYKKAVSACDDYVRPDPGTMHTIAFASSADIAVVCMRAAYSPFASSEERIGPLKVLASLFAQRRDFAFAAYALDELVVLQGADPAHRVSRGYLRVRTGKYDAAVRDYDAAFEIGLPTTHDAGVVHMMRGAAQYDAGRPEKALEDYTAAVRLLDPRSAESKVAQFAVERLRQERGR